MWVMPFCYLWISRSLTPFLQLLVRLNSNPQVLVLSESLQGVSGLAFLVRL